MSNPAKRYDVKIDDLSSTYPVENIDGSWVRSIDHDALEIQFTNTKNELETIKNAILDHEAALVSGIELREEWLEHEKLWKLISK